MSKHSLVIFPSTQVVASEADPTLKKSVLKYGTGCIGLEVTQLAAGASITVTVQDYIGGAWHDLVAFNTAAATGKQPVRSVTSFGVKLRTIYTLVGASATFAVTGVFERAR